MGRASRRARPETELLTEAAIAALRGGSSAEGTIDSGRPRPPVSYNNVRVLAVWPAPR